MHYIDFDKNHKQEVTNRKYKNTDITFPPLLSKGIYKETKNNHDEMYKHEHRLSKKKNAIVIVMSQSLKHHSTVTR